MTPLKVALINPPPWKIVEPWYDAPLFPRQSIGYVAGYLRQFPGFEIQIIDAKLERIGFREVVRRAVDFGAQVVGLTAFTNEIKPAAHVARLIKEELPHCVTVIGGVHVTALPVATLEEFSSFDVGCRGEGEVTFYELCRAIQEGASLGSIAGLVYRRGNAIAQTPERMNTLEMDRLPFPAYDLFPPFREFFIQSQRGCPFRCSFCMNPNGRIPRQRTVENVMEEMRWLLKMHPIGRMYFGDELFSVDMERSHRLLDKMLAEKIPPFWVSTHVGFVDLELFQKLRRAGCYEIGLGIETGDEDKLRGMGKGTNLKMIEEAFAAARQARVSVQSLFILGHPGETRASIRETIRFAGKLNPNTPVFGVMVPYPGTEVARLAARGEGGYRLATTDWDEFNKQVGGALEFAGLTRKQIERYQILGYLSVFLINRRFLDLFRFMWRYRIAGIRLLSSLFKSPMPRERSLPSTASLNEIANAASGWESAQRTNATFAKQFGRTELTRVVGKKRYALLKRQSLLHNQ